MRAFLALAFVFICLAAALARAQNGDTVTDDDVKRALHGGGSPTTSAHREYPAATHDQADEGEEAPTEESEVQPVTQGEATTETPAPSPDPGKTGKNSLMDLKAAQDELENDENAPALQPIGEGSQASCPSREVAATVKMPDVLKMIDPDGNRTKARKCEDSFSRLPDACAEDNPCTDCDKAVKAYTDACMYVQNRNDMQDMVNPNAGVGYTPPAQRDSVTKIPYQRGRSGQ